MKKILVVLLAVCFIPVLAYATTVDNHISGDTVSFRAISWPASGAVACSVSPTIVTFSSVTRHIRMMNLSVTTDCYANLTCRDDGNKRGHITTADSVVLLPAIGRATPNTVEIDFATRNIGFIGSVTTDPSENFRHTVHYEITGDSGDF